MRRRKWWALGALVGALTVLLAAPAGALPNNVPDTIRGYGSDGVYDIMLDLDRAFNKALGCAIAGNTGRPDSLTSNPDGSCTPPAAPAALGPENHDHDYALSAFGVGSSNGIRTLNRFGTTDFCGGTAGQPYPGPSCAYYPMDYARSSRVRSGSDNTNLRFVAYARTAVPWANWREGTAAESSGPAADVFNMTQQEVKDIYVNCSKRLWSDVGGDHLGQPDDRIIVWGIQVGSGTGSSFNTYLGASSDSACIPLRYKDANTTNGERIIFENDSAPIKNCLTHAGNSCATGHVTEFGYTEPTLNADTYLSSIFPFSRGAWISSPLDVNGHHGNGIDLGSVDGIAPTAPNIASGTYVFSNNVSNVYRNTYPSNNVPVPALDYVGEKGWICKGSRAGSGLPDAVSPGDTDFRGGHVTNPLTGVNFSVEIAGDTEAAVPYSEDGVIKNAGFVPIPFGPIGGGVTGSSHCRVS